MQIATTATDMTSNDLDFSTLYGYCVKGVGVLGCWEVISRHDSSVSSLNVRAEHHLGSQRSTEAWGGKCVVGLGVITATIAVA